MITTAVESLRNGGLEEIRQLLDGHYHELSVHHEKGYPLNPRYQVYLNREAIGEVLYVTLRDKGKLVGYFVGFLAPGLHYFDCLTLQLDIFYVLPEYRGNAHGKKLMAHVHKAAKDKGANLWIMGLKEAHRPHMEKLLLECGFEPFERHYSLWL